MIDTAQFPIFLWNATVSIDFRRF